MKFRKAILQLLKAEFKFAYSTTVDSSYLV
jgi:hypothetical protein